MCTLEGKVIEENKARRETDRDPEREHIMLLVLITLALRGTVDQSMQPIRPCVGAWLEGFLPIGPVSKEKLLCLT